MRSLKEKYALITGASGGIGKATACRFAEEGVNLILTDREVQMLEQLKQDLVHNNIQIEIISADLSINDSRKKLIESITNSHTKLDILIHSAGSIYQSPVSDTSDEKLEELFRINFYAPFQLTRGLLSLLKITNGQIVFINSSAIQRPIANLSHYSASKHALKGFADALREEVNPFGIRVTSVYPGKTATEMQQKLYAENNRKFIPELLIQPDDIAHTIADVLIMPQTVEITDIYMRPMQKS